MGAGYDMVASLIITNPLGLGIINKRVTVALDLRVEAWNRRDERAGVGVHGMREDLVGAPRLHDVAEVHDGDVVVAFLDGEFTLKRIRMDAGSQVLWLVPENEAYTPIRVDASNEFVIWGVVTYSIRRQSRRTK